MADPAKGSRDRPCRAHPRAARAHLRPAGRRGAPYLDGSAAHVAAGGGRVVTETLKIVVLGLSLSSTWGNGHATTYRALLRGLRAQGHRTLFLERDMPWYAAHRDLADPEFCTLSFYHSVDELRDYIPAFRSAHAVIIGSYVPEGREII